MPQINQSFNGRNTYQRLAQYACLLFAFLIAGNSLSRAAEIGCNCGDQTPPAELLASNDSAQGSADQAGRNSTGNSRTEATPIYSNPNVPVEKRIDDLLPRMTLEEKITQLIDSWGSPGVARLNIPAMFKTEGLHSQSYSTGATLFPMPIEMASTFDPKLINQVGVATAAEAKAKA